MLPMPAMLCVMVGGVRCDGREVTHVTIWLVDGWSRGRQMLVSSRRERQTSIIKMYAYSSSALGS